MAVYNSNYSELSFYVDGELRSFKNGRYATDNKDEIKVLDGMVDAVKVEDHSKDTANKKPVPQKKRVTTQDGDDKPEEAPKSTKKSK